MKKTAKFYKENPESRKKKAQYDKEFNKKPEQRAKRSELTQKNREADKNGVDRKGKDYDHAVGGYVKSSTNRGRKEKSRLKGSKRS
jgi:hypothetical protein